ncbi:SDR family NAD(P)-dependent oxidoreductase [Legionella fallonii]|uniref:Estradiol 17-beta-dehydrogenase n=1 Tax=Legionella fallonii LLAP-10 TaxID=1212491 RepID=A0A098GA61_9GAMM|nr:SDR family NAD(P)-dependent oxidoreductase [Legionella fallonii]CEG58872.1 Estradiol 17-beta-dehydrogenase [Legionella fallonii LLAP-10]
MSKILITGSTDGLGKMAAQLLIEQGHKVVLHARNIQRAAEVANALPGAQKVVIGDLSRIMEIKAVAEQANQLGHFDAIIHNAAIGYREPHRVETKDGLCHVFAINTLAPYILTALIDKPKRLVYLSSGMHYNADTSLYDLNWMRREWNGAEAYAETKFHNTLLAFAVARLCPEVLSNAVEPGWVATKMGGPEAPDDLDAAPRTQIWLATSNEPEALVSGQYFYHLQPRLPNPDARDIRKQEHFLEYCAEISGVYLNNVRRTT